MSSGQPSSAPPSYDTVLSTPSYGQTPSVPPPYSERPGLSPNAQNYSVPPPYYNLPYAPPGQGHSVTAESKSGSYSSRPNSYPSPNGGENVQASHESCECQDSCRHRGIVGRLLHRHHEHETHHHDQNRHHHDHHRHHGPLGLIRHLTHHESHSN